MLTILSAKFAQQEQAERSEPASETASVEKGPGKDKKTTVLEI